MQAILQADYSFTPIEYWRNVSQTARNFIKACLTVDPRQRMTAHQALQHPWINTEDPMSAGVQQNGGDLLPTVKKNFNARRTLHKAIDTVRAINKLREGGGLMSGHMDGQMSLDPKPKIENVQGSKVMDDAGTPIDGGAQGGGLHDQDAMDMDSRGNGFGQTADQMQRQEQKVQSVINEIHMRTRGQS